jgi:hypothetical protein
MKKYSSLFANAEKAPIPFWRGIFEGTKRLMGLLLRVPLIVSLRLSVEVGLGAIHFVRTVARLRRKSGFVFVSMYLFQCGVSLQRYYSGSYSKGEPLSVPIALTRTGIPTRIPPYIRKVIKVIRRHDDRADRWVRIDLSWFGVNRLIPLVKKVSSSTFESITKPTEDIDSVKEILTMIHTHGMIHLSSVSPQNPLTTGICVEAYLEIDSS